MSEQPAEVSNEPCGAPVKFAQIFTPVVYDTGHRCQRRAGHAGVHRWQQRWEGISPRQVEAELARDYDKWDNPDDE